MENYFQAEAYNLDKVLDEFEQNEGENLLWWISLNVFMIWRMWGYEWMQYFKKNKIRANDLMTKLLHNNVQRKN